MLPQSPITPQEPTAALPNAVDNVHPDVSAEGDYRITEEGSARITEAGVIVQPD